MQLDSYNIKHNLKLLNYYLNLSVFNVQCFCYFSISIALTWKMIKPHIAAIIQDIIFPLMCHSEADQELWETDPHEYISQKFGKN